MANVSDLLNPAPTSTSSEANRPQPLNMTSQPPHHVRKDSITSPGLDALAAAASNADPIVSPTNTTFGPTGFQSGFRRPSSGAHSHEGFQPPSHFSPTIPHYKPPISAERRLSSSGDRPLSSYQPSTFAQPAQYTQQESSNTAMDNTVQAGLGQLAASFTHPGRAGSGLQIDDAAAAEIKGPMPMLGQSRSGGAAPDTQSDQIQVKSEVGDVSMQEAQAPTSPKLELDDKKMDTNEQKDPGLAPPSEKAEPPAKTSPKPKAPSKKRAPPKKGTASAVKHPAKKRKLDGSTESVDGSPSRATPNRASGTPVPKNKKQASVTPDTRSSSVAGDDDDYDGGSDNDLFCICRKPDDHSVMIGCDGPCEDWFHLRCVDMTEAKTKLIQKWFCPNCSAQGHDTLWRRMCRLQGCSEPARTDNNGKNLSKYCSDAHGEEFMRRLVNGPTAEPLNTAETRSKRKSAPQPSKPDEAYEDPRGGVLKAPDLKAIVDTVKDAAEFQRLGEASVPSPPQTADLDLPNGHASDTTSTNAKKKLEYTDAEMAQLAQIQEKKAQLIAKREALADRDKFVDMCAKRRQVVLAQLKEQEKGLKDICGYDTRLTWSEPEFEAWRSSPEGRQALEAGILQDSSPSTKAEKPLTNGLTNGTTHAHPVDDDPTTTTTTPIHDTKEEEQELAPTVCKKKRCERHRAWVKREVNDNAFERNQVRMGIRKLEGEEGGVRDRAVLRGLERGDEGVVGGQEGVVGGDDWGEVDGVEA